MRKRPCGHYTDKSFCPITFKLHLGQRLRSNLALCVYGLMGTIQTTLFVQLVSNFTCMLWMKRGKTPFDFLSWGHRSRSTLPLCEGMSRFALSRLLIMMNTLQGRKLAMPFVPSYSVFRHLRQGKELWRKLWVRSLFSKSNSWVRIV